MSTASVAEALGRRVRLSLLLASVTVAFGVAWPMAASAAAHDLPLFEQRGDDIYGASVDEHLGRSVALSADGRIIAIGAPGSGWGGDGAGQVRVYGWDGTGWVQQGGPIVGDGASSHLGRSVALSAAGNILAVGATGNDDAGDNAGQVRMYVWDGSGWVQRGDDLLGDAAGDIFGVSVALSDDGNILAVGAAGNDDAGDNAGQVRVFVWDGSGWVQRGDELTGEGAFEYLGRSVALSADGSTLAAGALSWADGGAVRVHIWDGTGWVQRGDDIHGDDPYAELGFSVALSADGSILASGATWVDGGILPGQVRVYGWDGSGWVQRGDDIDGNESLDGFGFSVALSADGNILAAGAPGIDENVDAAGEVRMYVWDGSGWVQRGEDLLGDAAGDSFYDAGDSFGVSVALSDDGSILAAGAPGNDHSSAEAGQVRVYVAVDLTVAVPGDITVEAASPAGATVEYATPAAISRTDPDPSVTCTPASGSTFPLGTTTVTCTATDTAGNSATSSFDVTVVDTTPPSLVLPEQLTSFEPVYATGEDGAVVDYLLPTSGDPDATVVCDPPSGSLFPVGVTRVTCTATDTAGNSTSTSFDVEVLGTLVATGTSVLAVGALGLLLLAIGSVLTQRTSSQAGGASR